ncbi:hypothetical protein ACIG3E_16425 [Streptomyces sp. NPDC053474]|uniref:hypothetical protein n=1 Tax=Streptomyces sp. NPDC053474 TaxID=3365704 RepID=UPI0037CDD56E
MNRVLIVQIAFPWPVFQGPRSDAWIPRLGGVPGVLPGPDIRDAPTAPPARGRRRRRTSPADQQRRDTYLVIPFRLDPLGCTGVSTVLDVVTLLNP